MLGLVGGENESITCTESTSQGLSQLVSGSGTYLPDDVIDRCLTIMKSHANASMYNIVRLWEIASQNNDQYIVVRGECRHRQEKPSINIHLVNNHWVTSYYNPNTKKVHIYDSLWSSYATRFQSLLKQLQLVYGVLEQDVVYQPVQRQGSDPLCGPFAVAFGFTLLLGQNPVGMSFDVGKMRTHLEHVLTAGIIEPFPVKVRDATEAMQRARRIQFYKTQRTAENTACKRKYNEIAKCCNTDRKNVQQNIDSIPSTSQSMLGFVGGNESITCIERMIEIYLLLNTNANEHIVNIWVSNI
jgi:hypothetical protein